MFLNRLTSFTINTGKQTGFIVEVDPLLQKYDLSHILLAYLQDGVFPGKFAWKHMIKAKVHENARLGWYERVSSPEFYRFNMLHGEFRPHWIWLFSKENRKMLKPCISVVQLISCVSSLPHVSNICRHCQRCFTNLVDHCIHGCIYLNRSRARLLQEIFSLGADIYIYALVHARQTFINEFTSWCGMSRIFI